MMQKMENKEYLAMDGLPAFRAATLELLLGAGHPAIADGRAVSVQSLSGTGSLRVGAAFIAKWLPGKTVYLSSPTWCARAFLLCCCFPPSFLRSPSLLCCCVRSVLPQELHLLPVR